jgi:hypothetical protein
MDRTTAVNRYYSNNLNRALQAVMEIMAPGEQLAWGAKNHSDLVGLVACQLAVEYEALTGLPIIEMLNESGATTAPQIEMPAKPAAEVIAAQQPSQPIIAAQPEEDALPLT